MYIYITEFAFQIYSWAKEQLFERCSKHVMVWLGGVCGDVIHPAVADWGVNQRAFFTDLDTRTHVPAAKAECDLADNLVGSLDLSLPTPPLVMGCKYYIDSRYIVSTHWVQLDPL